jgi:hypothetical protein
VLLRKIYDFYHILLDKEVLQVYQTMPYNNRNYFFFHWSIEGKSEGVIDLLPLCEVFGGDRPYFSNSWNEKSSLGTLWFETMDEDVQNEIKQFKTLHPIAGTTRNIAIKVNHGKFDLYIIDRFDIVKLPCSFKEYLLLLIENMGYIYWEDLLLKKENQDNAAGPSIKEIQNLFPDFKI